MDIYNFRISFEASSYLLVCEMAIFFSWKSENSFFFLNDPFPYESSTDL